MQSANWRNFENFEDAQSFMKKVKGWLKKLPLGSRWKYRVSWGY